MSEKLQPPQLSHLTAMQPKGSTPLATVAEVYQDLPVLDESFLQELKDLGLPSIEEFTSEGSGISGGVDLGHFHSLFPVSVAY